MRPTKSIKFFTYFSPSTHNKTQPKITEKENMMVIFNMVLNLYIYRSETTYQIALAIKDEVEDLEKAGITVIQIDEAALREGLPLRKSEQANYLDWVVHAFRITNVGVQDTTQVLLMDYKKSMHFFIVGIEYSTKGFTNQRVR